MKHRYKTLSRVVSLLLTAAMLMTTPTFSVFAEEITAYAEIDTTDAPLTVSNEEKAATEEAEAMDNLSEFAEGNVPADESDEMTPELMALLLRSQEYDTFTDEEKRMVQAFFHMAPDEEELQKALDDQQRIQEEIASMPEKFRYENKVLEFQSANRTFSDLNEYEQALVLQYSAFPDNIDEAFRYFEKEGLDIYESALAAEIMVDQLFDAEESLQIFRLYDSRVEREKNVLGFKEFSKAFLDTERIDERAMQAADPLTIRHAMLREQKAEYVSPAAFRKAKDMFLQGYSAQEIRAAYSVAATYNLAPEDLLIDREKAPSTLSEEEQCFFAVYPVNVAAVQELMRSTDLQSTVVSFESKAEISRIDADDAAKSEISQVMEAVTSVGVALYSVPDEVEDDPVIESIRQPIDIHIDSHENVRINTGALEYRESIASLPGVNGKNIDLQLQYGSDESALEKYDYRRSTQTRYAIVGTQVEMAEGRLFEDTARSVVYKGYTSAKAANEALLEMQDKEIPCELTTPFVASKTATKVIRNTCEKSWWTNPYELLYDRQSNPAPSSYAYSSGGYKGTLPRTKTEKVYDNGTTVKKTDGDRICYYQKTIWEATFSGTVRKKVTEGSLVYVSLSVVEYSYSSAYNNTKEQTYNESRYDLGSGWSLGIPSIDRDSHGESLVLPGIGTYALSGNTIKDYKRSDMKLTSDKSYNNGQFDSTQKLTFADGTAYYFNSDGLLLAMVDKFGTTVTFKYAQVNGDYHPSEIIDADGSSTTIVYTATDVGKTVTITAPDGNATVLYIKALDSETYGENNSVLEKIVYPDGETVSFDYTMENGTYSFTGSSGGSDIQYALLHRVAYDTGAKLHYAYEMQDVKLGSGHLNTYRLTERYTTNGTDDMQYMNRAAYTYTGDYSRKSEYKTKITETKNGQTVSTEYTFSKDHLCTKQETKVDSKLKQKVETTYDSYELPNKTVTSIYGSSTLSSTELYTHDKFGNLLTYISPKADGSASNTEYRTTYTYDSTYNLPLTVEYKQDSATAVKTVNTLTEDGKNIAETATYVNGALAALTTYTYNARGQMTSKTECLDLEAKTGITTAYTYDGANLATETITGMTDADGNALPDLITTYTYDAMGRLLTVTDAAGRTTTNTYDVRGRLLTTTAPDGSVTEYTYDLAANDTTVSQPDREDFVVDFDSLGQKQAVYYPSGDLQKEYYYDNLGRLVIEATGRGSDAANTTYYAYDAFDRVTEKLICDKIGAVVYRETTAYDDALTETQSLVTKTVHGEEGAPDAVTKTYTNAYGEVVKTDVCGTVTEYAYDCAGNCARTWYTADGATVSTAYTHDFRGNVLTETNSLGDSRTVTYDAVGRKVSESDYKGNTTVYTYDAAGRLLISSAPLDAGRSSVVKYTYDGAGNITKQMQSAEAPDAAEPAWRTVEYTYDEMNRVTDIAQVADETHKVWTHYAYNAAGDLTDIYTGLSVKWTAAVNPDSYSHTLYVYNNRGKATSLTDALGQTETYVYDALGYLIEATGRDGKVTRYAYNSLGKPLYEAIYASRDAEAPVAETVYTYYRNSLTRSVTVDGNAVLYTYDARGNVLTETDAASAKAYAYDARGRKSGYALTVVGEAVSTAIYAYDILDRLTSVTEGGVTTTYTYDTNGNRASQTTGAVSVAYTYNDANLVTSLTNTMTNAAGEEVVISAFEYTYYADGNQYTKTETLLGGDPVTTTYVYDGLGRLAAETKGEDSITYTYDARGNRVGMTADGKATTYVYDANNRLLSETVNGETTAYTYDANGNLLTAGDKTYTYNERGQQTGYSDGTNTAAYTYNPNGLRNLKTVGGSTKYFVYNGMNIVYEYSESVADGVAYYYGLNRTHNSNGEIYVYNAHGDVVQLVKDNAVEVSYTYDAFGNLTSQIGESDNPFLYCGEYFDAETQTYYLRARYYNPANGRFTQQDAWAFMDTGDPLSLNLYAYCCNNPVMYVDITGNWPTFAQIATAVAVVAVGAVLVAATIASAGTVGAVAGAAAATYFGASATAAATVTTVATVGTYAVAAGVGATYASDAGEILTGHNVIRDDLMGGNQEAYDIARLALSAGTAGATYIYGQYGYAFSPADANTNGAPKSIIVDSGQLGKKYGEHKADYPNMSHNDYKAYAEKIFKAPDAIYYDRQAGEFYYLKGQDLLRVKEDGNFVSLYPGATSARVTNISNGR